MTLNKPWAALAIETSGHILRIFGHEALRRDLENLLARFEVLGTTAFTCHEFDVIVGGLYNTIRKAMEKLPYPDRGRSFADLSNEALFEVPPFIKGGPKLLNDVLNRLESRFDGFTPTPRQVARECSGQLQAVTILARRVSGRVLTIHDGSTCCMWSDSLQEKCRVEPKAGHCKLARFCSHERSVFLASLETLGKSNVSESVWIRGNLESLRLLDGVGFLKKVADNPNPLGDAIIFWEIASDFDILTRDRAFAVLQRGHRTHQRVFFVRAPRHEANATCVLVLPARNSARVQARFANISTTGAMIDTAERLEVGTQVSVDSEVFAGPRSGVVISTEESSKEWRSRVAFKTVRSKPPKRHPIQEPDADSESGAI